MNTEQENKSLLESLQMCLSEESPLSPMAKDVVRGFFITHIKPVTKAHEHSPDWDTLTYARKTGGIVDMQCNDPSCGISGSVRIDPEDIQWDES